MRIFVDTGAWIAIADRNDQYAKIASQFYTDIIHQHRNLITSDMILVETFNLLIEPITHLDWERGWKIFDKYDDKDFSFTDCTSFALMERLKVKSAFAFDVHFRQYGFRVFP